MTGGRAENAALLEQKFDFVFFTGSQAVGKEVLRHAAEHLTPCVLELGGKSPCIVDNTAKIKLAAKRIVFGKYLNCGQTCVAPDYVLCHKNVKDELVKYLTPILAQADTKEMAMSLVKENMDNISRVAGLVLQKEGYTYGANAKLKSEYFPLRCYDDVVLESGEYDSLIVELGSGTGNNWWCVVYPPLCFVATEDDREGITYRSKILDIINRFFGG